MPSRLVLVTLSIITTQTALAQPVATPYLHGNFGDVEFRRGGPGLSVGYFGRRLGVELDLDRHHHFYKDDELESIPNPCVPSVPVGMCIDNDTEAWIVMGNVLAFLPVSSARWRPYGTAGTGLIHAWIHGAGPYDSEQNNLGVNLGVGTTFRLNDWFGLRADVRYFHVFVDGDEPDGGYTEDYDFVRVSLGFTFSIPSL
jgi:opacity protein-like surface antigen